MNHIKKLTHGFTAAMLLGVVGSINVSAWGPERTTFTMDAPATYPVFNSITDNPTIGDERDFVRVGEINAEVTDLTNNVEVIPGKQYLVYVYFHNNASSTFNDSAHNNSGIAVNTRMSTAFPTVLTAGEESAVSATITADNTNPLSVWDDAYFTTSASKVLLSYVPGSAKIYNDWPTNGSVLADKLFTEAGTLIGLTSLNGAIPGCEEYHGVVTYVLQAEELSGTIDKTVSVDGTNFSEQVEINPGEEVTFKLDIKNTGDRELTNVVVKDVLPAGLELIPGTVRIWANESTTEDTISDDIVKNGVNIGTVGTGNTVHITFRAKAGDDFDCEGTNMRNTATITYDSDVATGDTDEDTASVIVKKDGCEPTPTPTPEPTPTPTPDVLPNTGPVEITMAIIIVVGIAGGCFYLYRTRKSLKTIENTAAGKDVMAEKDESGKDSSQNPDNMVK